jgi:hypothetical protein
VHEWKTAQWAYDNGLCKVLPNVEALDSELEKTLHVWLPIIRSLLEMKKIWEGNKPLGTLLLKERLLQVIGTV